MKRFLIYIVSCVLPIIIILLAFEYTLRSIPNSYGFKDKVFTTLYAPTVKILSFGSSHGFWGINPSFFYKPAYNLGFPTQSLKYDYYLLNKYINLCDSLQYVILPISYNSFRDNLDTGGEWNRTKGYCIYMGCNYHQKEPKYNYELFGNFNTKMLQTVWNTWLGKESHIICDSLGYGLGYCYCNRSENWINEGNRAAGHTIHNRKFVKENTEYLRAILNICNTRGINVLMVTTPTYKSYYEHIDVEQYHEMQEICEKMLLQYPDVRYYNWIRDKRFGETDFYDGDHLNEFGSQKLTMLLNEIVENWK